MIADQVDVAVRLYDMAEIPCLRSLLFSVLGQMRPAAPSGAALTGPVKVRLMTQRFTVAELQAVRGAVTDLLRLDERVGLVLHNWDYRDPFDLRAPLLNLALEAADGRYFTCLDTSDLLLPGALATLLGRLRLTQAVGALGGVATQPVRWWGDVFLPAAAPRPPPPRPPPKPPSGPVPAQAPGGDSTQPPSDLPPEAPPDAPAPIFVLDSTRRPKTLGFEAVPPGQEVTGFLRRLRRDHAVDDGCETDVLAVRQVYRT